jgi:hypothetical protein
MPADLYTPEKLVDPFEVAQSLMFTNEYQDQIIGKYLYNEECPDKSDSCYAYPEIREKFKALLTDEGEAEAPKAARPRPGAAPARAAAPVVEPEPAPAPPIPDPAPVRGRPAAAQAAAPARTAAAPAAAPAAGRPAGRPSRNVADDLKEV